MNKTIIVAISLVAAIALGIVVGRMWIPAGNGVAGNSGKSERQVLYWKAPMDPNYRGDKPGKSPMGMELIPVYADEVAGDAPGVVSIDSKVVNNLGVRTAYVERSPLSRRVETVGYVGYDEDTVHHIHSRVDGWIEMLAVKDTGDPVKRGQVLFELYSPTLVNAQEEYLAALKSRNAPLHRASKERLAALGMTQTEIERLDSERTVTQRVRIYAETDGVVTHLGIRQGNFITPATDIMSIAKIDRVWVLAEVFERQAAWVQVGQRAEVDLDYLPGLRLHGTVDYVYPELDPKTRTLKVRLRFDNKAETLRPNMFARITIFGTETPPVIHIPREALIRGGSVNRVVLALGEGKFRAQPVAVGIEAGDRVEIRAGLSAGDRVVTSGQFLIDSESNIGTALARMSDSPADEPPTHAQAAAIVRGIDATNRKLTLQHEPVAEWSWPAMTMSFDVVDGGLLDGLSQGQSVDVTFEKQPGDNYVITAVAPAEAAGHSAHRAPLDAMVMDHIGDDKEPKQ